MNEHYHFIRKVTVLYHLRKISILFVFIIIFFSGYIRTDIYAQEKNQGPTDATCSANSLTLSVIGDVMIHETQLTSAWDPEGRCYTFDSVFSHVKDILSAADLTIGNLETTLPGKTKLYSGYPAFGSPDAIASALKAAGVDILTTANNHSCDKGKRGLVRTIEVLDEQGILHLGTYRSKEAYETQRVLIVESNGIRLALLCYTYGVNNMQIPEGTHVNLIDRGQITDDIMLARVYDPDFIVVLLHWGTEYQRYPDQAQKEMVEFLFSEGVDIVLGGHPHVLQPFELRPVTDKYGDTKPRLVIYSLGNFVSSQRDRYRDGGIVFNFTLHKHCPSCAEERPAITNVHYIPTWVYIDRTGDENHYYILPVLEYLKNDQPLQLPDNAYQKMLTFYCDTELHLRPTQMQVNGEEGPVPGIEETIDMR